MKGRRTGLSPCRACRPCTWRVSWIHAWTWPCRCQQWDSADAKAASWGSQGADPARGSSQPWCIPSNPSSVRMHRGICKAQDTYLPRVREGVAVAEVAESDEWLVALYVGSDWFASTGTGDKGTRTFFEVEDWGGDEERGGGGQWAMMMEVCNRSGQNATRTSLKYTSPKILQFRVVHTISATLACDRHM